VDFSTRSGARFSMHAPNLIKISLSALDICHQNGIRKTPPGGGILLSVPSLTTTILRGPSYVSSCIISASELAILPFYIVRFPFGPSNFRVGEIHPYPVGTIITMRHAGGAEKAEVKISAGNHRVGKRESGIVGRRKNRQWNSKQTRFLC